MVYLPLVEQLYYRLVVPVKWLNTVAGSAVLLPVLIPQGDPALLVLRQESQRVLNEVREVRHPILEDSNQCLSVGKGSPDLREVVGVLA